MSVSGSSANHAAACADRQLGDLADVQAGELHRQRLRLQAIAAAGLAGLVRLVARQLLAHPGGVGLPPAPLEVGDHALEGLDGLVVAQAVVVDEGDLLLAGAVEDDVADLLGQLLPRRGHRLAIVRGERLQRLLVIGRGGRLAPTARWRPRRGSSSRRGRRARGRRQLGAEPVADRAGAERVVEREQPRLDLVDGEAGDRAGEFAEKMSARVRLVLRPSPPRKPHLPRPLSRCGQRLVGELGDGDAVGELERRLEAVGEPRGDVRRARPCGRPPRRCRA